ncbi:MAG: hypothetical protein ACOC5S_01630 [Acidobacteriota bacterium]
MSFYKLSVIIIPKNLDTKKGGLLMGKFFAILLGLIAMAGGIVLVIFVWTQEFLELLFGCIPPILFFGGLIALVAGISSIKDAARTKKLEEEVEEEEKAE